MNHLRNFLIKFFPNFFFCHTREDGTLTPIINLNNLYFWLIIFSLYLVAGYMQIRLPLNPDVSWLMHAAERMFATGTYTKDFFEPNPPLILYLNFPVILLAKLFHTRMLFIFYSYVFLLASLSFFLCYFLIRFLFSKQDILIANLFLIALIIIFLITPIYEFGQREHFSIILCLPYLLMLACRLQHKKIHPIIAASIGVLAGIGFIIKPHFLVVPIFLEIYFLYRQKNMLAWMRIDLLVMLSMWTSYLALIAVLHPDYFFIVVPYALQLYYQGANQHWEIVIKDTLFLFCNFSLLLYWTQHKQNPCQALASILSVALIGYTVVHLLQKMNYYYHIYPAFSIALLLYLLSVSLIALKPQNQKDYGRLISLFVVPFFIFLCLNCNTIWTSVVLSPFYFFSFFGFLFGLWFYIGLENKNIFKTIGVVSLILSLSFLFLYFIQRDSLQNHQCFFTILLMFLLFSLMVSLSHKNKFQIIGAAFLSMLIFSFPARYIIIKYQIASQQKVTVNQLANFLQQHALHQSIYCFATSYFAFPTVDYSNVTSASRFPFFWMLPGLIKLHRDTDKAKNFFIDMVCEDFLTHQPSLVLIDMNKHKNNLWFTSWANNQVQIKYIDFDYLSYFSSNKKFQTIWKNYHYLTTLKLKTIFSTQTLDVYQRNFKKS